MTKPISPLLCIKLGWGFFKGGFLRHGSASLGFGIAYYATLIQTLMTTAEILQSHTLSFGTFAPLLGWFVLMLLLQTFAVGFIITNCQNLQLQKHYSSFQVSYLVAQHFPKMLLGTVLFDILLVAGLRLYLIPGILVAGLCILYPALIMIEHRASLEALSRSLRQTKNHFSPILTLGALNIFLIFGATSIVQLIAGKFLNNVAHFQPPANADNLSEADLVIHAAAQYSLNTPTLISAALDALVTALALSLVCCIAYATYTVFKSTDDSNHL